MENRNWIIIDCISNRALYGCNEKTLRFSTQKIAYEVAGQFFDRTRDFIVFDISKIVN